MFSNKLNFDYKRLFFPKTSILHNENVVQVIILSWLLPVRVAITFSANDAPYLYSPYIYSKLLLTLKELYDSSRYNLPPPWLQACQHSVLISPLINEPYLLRCFCGSLGSMNSDTWLLWVSFYEREWQFSFENCGAGKWYILKSYLTHKCFWCSASYFSILE